MILVDHEIKALINSGELGVTPFDEKLVNTASLNFRLSEKIWKIRPSDCYTAIDLQDKLSFEQRNVYWDTHITPLNPKGEKFYIMEPGEFLLASAMERIKLPNNVAMKVYGRSSWGRAGLDNSQVAGYADPGFEGVMTLELVNHGNFPIIIRPGQEIGQYVFMRTSSIPDKDYSVNGRYAGQDAGQGSKGI